VRSGDGAARQRALLAGEGVPVDARGRVPFERFAWTPED
jgi:alkylated DNA nucleotide flippase Atl1